MKDELVVDKERVLELAKKLAPVYEGYKSYEIALASDFLSHLSAKQEFAERLGFDFPAKGTEASGSGKIN